MQPALQQNSGPAKLQHFVNLFVDRFKRKQVAIFRAQWTVKRAEGAIFRAEICVINVPVNLIRRHVRIILLIPHSRCRHPDADQIIGGK